MNAENQTNLEQSAEIVRLNRKIDELERAKRRVGISFRRVPESGYQISRLYNGDFPYFQHIPVNSYTTSDRNKELAASGSPLTVAGDGNITLIEGDNLPVLAALQLTHKGRIDVIYIDPPYNTGNEDFIYNDARKSSMSDVEGATAEEYEATLDGKARSVGKDDPERHSLWLSFMEKRLYLAKSLLSETGVIFVSIDDNEQARLKLLMDEVFGEQNFINNIIVKMSELSGVKMKSTNRFAKLKEYVFLYAKDRSGMSLTVPIVQKNIQTLKGYLKYYSKYITNPTELPEKWILADIKNNPEIIGLSDEALATWKVKNASTLVYRTTSKTVTNYLKYNPTTSKISSFFNKDGKKIIRWDDKELLLLSDYITTPVGDLWLDISTINLNKEGAGIMFENGQKPIKLIKRVIESTGNPNAIVLDFFAGSGTTAHAVAELNAEDGGTRQCILVTHGDENGKNIAEDVTAERIKRVLSGLNWADGKEHAGLNGELNYYKLSFAPKTDSPLKAIETMQTKFVGYAALQQDVIVVPHAEVNDNMVVLESSKKLVVVITNEEYLLYENDDLFEQLNALKEASDKKEFIVYTPSESKDDLYGFSQAGWKNISFPIEYLENHAKLIDRMKKNRTLLAPVADEQEITETLDDNASKEVN